MSVIANVCICAAKAPVKPVLTGDCDHRARER
jgi:hypothetical protein